ncbi:MAG: hypothetical protein Q8P18_01820 [Pseudomonadota bacterium]|nr:hypothetical protein [Pseudomonadota bacterium]
MLISPVVPLGWYAFRRYQESASEAEWQRLAPEELAAITMRVDALNVGHTACVEAWDRATKPEALSRLTPLDLACNAGLKPPTESAAQAYVSSGSIDGNHFGAWSLRRIAPGERMAAPTCGRLGAEVAEARAALAGGVADRDLLRQVNAVDESIEKATVVMLVAEIDTAPIVGSTMIPGDTSFLPGHVLGRAYVYDGYSRAIVCSGEVEAANSAADVVASYAYLEGSPSDRAGKSRDALASALDRDLEVQLRRVIVKNLLTTDPASRKGMGAGAP